MTEPNAAEVEDEANEILSLELSINNGEFIQARVPLRKILLRASNADGGGTIGDALAGLCKNAVKHRLEAILVARCLAVQGIMPEPNATNQIVRLVVELCEAAIPDIVSFLKINNRAQNIEKYLALADCHNRIEAILDPLRTPYGDLTALLSARKDIVGCLNHSIIRQYAAPFLLKETRGTVESIFGHLKRMSEVNTSLLTDIDECHRSIERAKSEATATAAFLSSRFLHPFLLTAEKAVASFVETLRGRFLTSISLGPGIHSELQKRYPLHEPSRELQIIIPLRNTGPDLATDLEVTATTDNNAVMLAGGSIKLGNVLPGEFSAVLDAMVMARCEKFAILLNVEWGEIGNPSRKTEVFEVIPNVNSRESTKDKHREVEEIMDALGTWRGVDDVTGFHLIELPDGRKIKIADLVDDDPVKRDKVSAALKDPAQRGSRDHVDIIIALGMAKEGFDWIWCEHALTVAATQTKSCLPKRPLAWTRCERAQSTGRPLSSC